jgi:hypothetical protein
MISLLSGADNASVRRMFLRGHAAKIIGLQKPTTQPRLQFMQDGKKFVPLEHAGPPYSEADPKHSG